MIKNKKTLIKTPQASKTIVFAAWREFMKLIRSILDAAAISETESLNGARFAINALGDISNISDTGKAIKFNFEGSRSFVLLTKTGYQLHGDTLPQRWQFSIENYLKTLNITNVDDYEYVLATLKARNEAMKADIVGNIILKKPSKAQLSLVASSFINKQATYSRNGLYKNLRIDSQIVSESERDMVKRHIAATTKELQIYSDNITKKLIDQTNENFFLGKRATNENARALAKVTQESVKQSRNLLIQQAHRTNSEVVHINARRIGLNEFIWRTVENEKVCPICEPLNGREFKMTELPKDKTPGFIHPHCNCYRDLIVDDEIRNILQEVRKS